MKTYTVTEVAKLAGITVKALHHYDEIGLLKPAFVGENRYRYYGRDELLRLQQIMLYRELDIPLKDIGVLLDQPRDRLSTLQEQKARLEAEAKRYRQLIRTIDRTIADLNGEKLMKDADLYKASRPKSKYEAWLIDRFGGDMAARIDQSRQRYESLTPAQREKLGADYGEVERALAEGLRRGVPPQSTALDSLLARHRAWVAAMWSAPCSFERYAGLADLYLSHPDFVARYEQIEPGFCRLSGDGHESLGRAHAIAGAPGTAGLSGQPIGAQLEPGGEQGRLRLLELARSHAEEVAELPVEMALVEIAQGRELLRAGFAEAAHRLRGVEEAAAAQDDFRRMPESRAGRCARAGGSTGRAGRPRRRPAWCCRCGRSPRSGPSIPVAGGGRPAQAACAPRPRSPRGSPDRHDRRRRLRKAGQRAGPNNRPTAPRGRQYRWPENRTGPASPSGAAQCRRHGTARGPGRASARPLAPMSGIGPKLAHFPGLVLGRPVALEEDPDECRLGHELVDQLETVRQMGLEDIMAPDIGREIIRWRVVAR